MLEAEAILKEVVQRRRRAFGPALPATVRAEGLLFDVREKLASG